MEAGKKEPPRTKSDDYPLPAGWKRAVHDGKAYFLNSATRETSWIDPRDKLWKKMTWAECGPDEIPYGWEVRNDPRLGRYFVDHINRKNLLDDPRSSVPQQQMQEVKKAIEVTARNLDSKKQTLRLKKDEVEKLRQQYNLQESAGGKSGPQPAQGKALAEVKKSPLTSSAPGLTAIDELQKEVAQLESEISTNSDQVSMMAAVVSNLESGASDQLQRQQEVQKEIEELQSRLAAQTQIRNQIQDQLTSMQKVYTSSAPNKQNLRVLIEQADTALNQSTEAATEAQAAKTPIKVAVDEQSKNATPQKNTQQPQKQHQQPASTKIEPAVSTTNTHAVSNPDAAFGVGLSHVQPMTRIEREMELLALKKQIEMEANETARLREIAIKAKTEVEEALKIMEAAGSGNAGAVSDGKAPKWIKMLNENANKSATIRLKAKQRAQEAVEAGQVMSFTDKLLFFTAEQQQVNVALSTPKRK